MGKILIADCLEEFRTQLEKALEGTYEVACCAEGERALELLEELRPDLLILDPMLIGMDGLEVLHQAHERKICPETIITGRFFSDHLLNMIAEYPVQYVLRKPCVISALVNRVGELLGQEEKELPREQDPHGAVTTMLHELGIPTNYAGFHQIRMGVLMLAKEPGLAMTKVVYPTIAAESKRGANSVTVERNIRSAIGRAYANRDDRVWRRYFLPAANGQIPKPTNTQFLTRLAEEVSCNVLRNVSDRVI